MTTALRRPTSASRPALHTPHVPEVLDVGPSDDEPVHGPYPIRPVRPWAQIVTRLSVWIALGIGCVGGLAGLLRPTAAPAPPPATESADGDLVPATVANYAEMAVGAWLTATEQDHRGVDAMFSTPLNLEGVGNPDREVVRVVTVGGSRIEQGYWRVTVLADLIESPGDEDTPPVTAQWFLEVGILGRARGGMVAVDPPALAPRTKMEPGELVFAGVPMTGVSDQDPVARTVQGFFEAYLAGTGDLQRYLAQGVRGTPVVPVPFTQVTLRRMSSTEVTTDELLIRTEVLAVTPTGAQQALSYELRAVRASNGRWEIIRATGAPTLTGLEGDPNPAPSTTVSRPTTSSTSSTTTTTTPGGPDTSATVPVPGE